MSTVDRRSARNQALPPEEVAILASLKGYSLYARASQLFQAGWTLRAIGEAFHPPKSRSTVKSWVDRGIDTAPTSPLPFVGAPTLATPPAYIPIRAASPGISSADLHTIKELAPISRKYRASMSPRHAAAIANARLTELCLSLYNADVPIKELADAAGVTYRAMSKRLGK
jgi:hypothetical protein